MTSARQDMPPQPLDNFRLFIDFWKAAAYSVRSRELLQLAS